MIRFVFLFCLVSSIATIKAQSSQNVVVSVIDNSSGTSIGYISLKLTGTNFLKSSISDSAGNYIFHNIPVGRYNIEATCTGYNPFMISDILVNSAKETFVSIRLTQKINLLREVIVKPRKNKGQPLNPMASVSTAVLSVEKASRYAGGFDDPARLVSAFAGVSSNVGNNGISVRGNNPKSMQWKFEGIEISNPNHFADGNVFGGGVLSALSSHNLGNSDFFSGAFPAEYSNALSGVFDMNLRKGNSTKKEHTVQIGLTGLDYAEEGPFKKGGKATYIYNYRYSTLALVKPLLPENGGKGVKYQDLSFKFNFPTKKAGTFTLWGLGLKDYTGIEAKKDTLKWETIVDRQSQDISLYMATVGFTHKYFINRKTYIKSILASTTNHVDYDFKQLQRNGNVIPESSVNNRISNTIFSSLINTKFGSKHTNKTGVTITGMSFNLKLSQNAQTIVNETGGCLLLNAYSSSTYNFSDNLKLNLGINAQLFTLNQNYTIEPRLGLNYQLDAKQSLSFGYGMHSRLEQLYYYFARNAQYGNAAINKNVDFAKAHHFVLGYDVDLSENLHLKIEPYYQYLFNVPVVKDSSISVLNITNDYFFNQKFENSGKGKNYGVDISLDKFLTNGLYYSATASLFNSEYQGGDKIWRDTRFNRKYVYNFLLGKEWTFGKSNQKSFGANIRLSYQGGDRYSPADLAKSTMKQDVVFDESKAFSKQLIPSFTTHITLVYRVNKPKSSRELALKILNAGSYKEFYDFQYNYKNQAVQEHREAIIIPNLSYKIEF